MKTFCKNTLKTTLILVVAILPLISFAQSQELPIDKETGLINFTEVIPVEGTNKDELYLRARAWFAETYNSSKSVLEMEDKEAGLLIGNALSDIYITAMGMPIKIKLWYKIRIAIKDGRYKYDITDMAYEGYASAQNPVTQKVPAEDIVVTHLYKKNGKPRAISQSYKDETIKMAESLSARIKTSMEKSLMGTNPNKEDW